MTLYLQTLSYSDISTQSGYHTYAFNAPICLFFFDFFKRCTNDARLKKLKIRCQLLLANQSLQYLKQLIQITTILIQTKIQTLIVRYNI